MYTKLHRKEHILYLPEGFALQLFPTSVLNGSEVLEACDFSASALHFFPSHLKVGW